MPFSHILVTRPRAESMELAELLAPTGAKVIIMPAYDFYAGEVFQDQISQLRKSLDGAHPALLIFTSPRSVEFGLAQIPQEVLGRSEIAAIGPSTAGLLEKAGVKVSLRPQSGYTSEDLLVSISAHPPMDGHSRRQAFILTAPDGRTALIKGLEAKGYESHNLMVYGRRPATLGADDLEAIEQADTLLAVWTSANAMTSLSQRLPAQSWSLLCQAEWLVISERLQRLARAFRPKRIHLASGPGNVDIVTSIQAVG